MILQKKSWHVWNRENVEKVKRDERLDREKREREEGRARENLQEFQLTSLKAQVEQDDSNSTILSNNLAMPSKVLSDVLGTLGVRASEGNADYKREKEEEELLKKRREGLAPWSLGEGSVEKSVVKPWYYYLSDEVPVVSVLGKNVVGEEAALAKEREERRKSSMDPMAGVIKGAFSSVRQDHNLSENSIAIPKNRIIPGIGDIEHMWGLSATSTINKNNEDLRKRRGRSASASDVVEENMKKKRKRSPSSGVEEDHSKKKHKNKKKKRKKKDMKEKDHSKKSKSYEKRSDLAGQSMEEGEVVQNENERSRRRQKRGSSRSSSTSSSSSSSIASTQDRRDARGGAHGMLLV